MMQYKISPIDVLWSLKDGLTIHNCGKKMPQDGQNFWRGFWILLHFVWYGGMMNWRQVGRTGSLVVGFWSILNFGSLVCQKTIYILELWVLRWNIGRTFWSCYQDLSHNKVLFCWKVFSLLTIKKLIMSAHPFVPLLMLTLKILSSLHTLGLEACTLLWTLLHTCLFMTCLLVILFLCNLQTL